MTIKPPPIFRYQGRSMWPCFQEGDLLEYTSCEMADVRIGDCIVYLTKDERHVTHRVIYKKDELTARGDAFSSADDDPVSPAQVIGKISQRHRNGQKSKVSGGFSGRIAGRFYHYAGRIDPQRDALGGQIARRLQAVSMRGLKSFRRTGRSKKLMSGNGEDTRVWIFGRIVIGKQDNQTQDWTVVWPWSILVKIKEDL